MVFDQVAFAVIVLWALKVCASLALIGKLIWTRLIAVYPWLFLFVAAEIAETILRIGFHEQEVQIYRGAEIVRTVLAVAVLWELVRLGFEGYSALSAFIRKASWYMIAGCLAFSFLNWAFDPTLPEGRSPMLHETLAAVRAVTSGLFAYLLLLIGFMGWFPVRMRRNVAFLLVGLAAYFSARWLALLGSNLSPDDTSRMRVFELAVVAACAVSWTFLLTREGERTQTITGHRWNPAEMARLSKKLDAINTGLVRMGP